MSSSHRIENEEKQYIYGPRFFKIYELHAGGEITAKCVRCEQEKNIEKIISGHITSTSNYHKHLKNKHQVVFNLIVKGAFDISILKNEEFKSWILGLERKVELPNTEGFLSKVDHKFYYIQVSIREIFSRGLPLTISVDVVKFRKKPILVIAGHWIEPEEVDARKSTLLSCHIGDYKFDKSSIIKKLQETYRTYDLNISKVQYMVIDSIMSENTEFYNLSFKIGESHGSNFTANFSTSINNENIFRAFSHNVLKCNYNIIMRIASHDFLQTLKPHDRVHNSTFTKCEKLWTIISISDFDTDICKFVEVAKTRLTFQLYIKFIGLISDSIDSCNKILSEVAYVTLNVEEILYLREFHSITKLFAKALDLLLKKESYHMAYFLPSLFTLRFDLKTLNRDSFQILGDSLSTCISIIEDHFSDSFSLNDSVNDLIMSTSFHPYFKLKWLANDEVLRSRVMDLCIERTKLECGEYVAASVESQGDSPMPDDSQEEFLGYTNTNSPPAKKKRITILDLEIAKFLTSETTKSLMELHKNANLKQMFCKQNVGFAVPNPVRDLLDSISFFELLESHESSDYITKISLLRSYKIYIDE